ncbi:MAG: hypothetical protein Q9201_002311 [Fulgogasparrea decipioides]
MTVFTISGALCLLGLAQWVIKRLLRVVSDEYPAGPKPLGIFGNVFHLKRLQSCPDKELMSIARKWSDTCMIWAAQYPILILNKPHAVKELLVDVCLAKKFTAGSKGHMYSSRPEPNTFRSSIWPWRLPIISAGEKFRYLRRLYQSLLSPQRALEMRRFQESESLVLLTDLLNRPQEFFEDVDRYSLSVIFSAVYGIRLSKLDNPITAELSEIWLCMLQRKD